MLRNGAVIAVVRDGTFENLNFSDLNKTEFTASGCVYGYLSGSIVFGIS